MSQHVLKEKCLITGLTRMTSLETGTQVKSRAIVFVGHNVLCSFSRRSRQVPKTACCVESQNERQASRSAVLPPTTGAASGV
jgi:hypothetical protein